MNWWIKELYLYESDRDTLFEDVELSDAVINAAQTLLKAHYDIAGFQNTLLGDRLKFRPISRYSKSVQIMNTGEYNMIVIIIESQVVSYCRQITLGMCI